MSRSILLNIATKAKSDSFWDYAIRYNPAVRKNILRLLHSGDPHLCQTLLERMLRAARKTPYGMAYGNVLADWPLLEKAEIRANPKKFLNRTILVKLPAATGGTTGLPLKLWRSLECAAAEQIFIDDLLAPYGHSIRRSRLAILRVDSFKTDDPDMPYARLSHDNQRLTLASCYLNADTVASFCKALERFQPDVMWVYPEAALNLKGLMERKGLRLTIPIILASSALTSIPLQRELSRFFSSRVINFYGQSERVCLAVSTEPGVFQFNPLYGHVELLPSQMYSSDSNDYYEVIATGFWNKAMPLIRYRTGDLILAPKNCSEEDRRAIARGQKPFDDILGRDNEHLVAPDGSHIVGVNYFPREVDHIAQIQLIQTAPDALTIRVIPLEGYSAADEQALLANARTKVPNSISIRFETAVELLLNQRGKAPYVIRQFQD